MEIGIDCGGTKTEGIVVHKGRIMCHVKLDTSSTKDAVLELVAMLLGKCSGVSFIGIGFPAPVMNGWVARVNNISGWDGINVEALIKSRFRLLCKAENDAKCFALAEAKQKENLKYRCVVGITLGTGIGCGVVADKRIVRGCTGAFGEISRIPYIHSILENYTSKQFFLNEYRIEPKVAFSKSDTERGRQMLGEFAIHIGRALAIVALCYDPDCIVLGGSISKSWKQIEKHAISEMKKHIYPNQHIAVKQSVLPYAGCIGASMLERSGN